MLSASPENRSVPASTGACQVIGLTRISRGSFPKISPDGNLVAFTDEVEDPNDPLGFSFQIFSMRIDGVDRKCLTENKPALANTRWRGQPYWHPNGRYIVFTAETGKYPRKGVGITARPGLGRNHNVWIMTADGSRFWQMTDYPDNWGAIRPSFSHDGKILYWNEEFSMEKYPNGKPGVDKHPGSYWGRQSSLLRKGEELGAWRVKLADLSFENSQPIIANIRSIDPPPGYTLIEGEGFSPDDKKLVYSYCHLQQEGGQDFWGDIYTSALDGTQLTNLTKSPRVHDENGQISPDGTRIIWNHGKGDPGEEDLYLMNSDGNNKIRLTYFTDPKHKEYDPNARQITESDWTPDGRSIVFGHVSSETKGGVHIFSDLYRLDVRY